MLDILHDLHHQVTIATYNWFIMFVDKHKIVVLIKHGCRLFMGTYNTCILFRMVGEGILHMEGEAKRSRTTAVIDI